MGFRLAVGAIISAPLPNPDFPHRCAAFRAGFPFPLVDFKIVLKLATAIDPIQTGAKHLNANVQHILNGCMQPDAVFHGKRIRPPLGVQASLEERLVGVDVPQTGQKTLVHEQGFDLPLMLLQHLI